MFLHTQSIHIHKGHKIMNFNNLTELNSEVFMHACMHVCMWSWLSATRAGGVLSSYQLAQILHLYSWQLSPATCTDNVFSKQVTQLVCTNAYECTLQLASCGGVCGDSVYIYTCVYVCVSVRNTAWQWCIRDDSQGRVLYVVVNNSEVLQGDLHCVVISTVCAF